MAYQRNYFFVRGKGAHLGGAGGTLINLNTIDSAISEYDKSGKIYKGTLADSKKIGVMLAKYLNDEVTVYEGTAPTSGFQVARFKARSNPIMNTIDRGKWIPVHAVRFNQDGSVSLLGEHASTDNPAKLSRFQKLERQLEAKGAYSPGGLARYIGVKKYGAKGFARLQARGRKKR